MDCIRLNGYEKKKLSKNNARLRGLAPDFIGGEAVFQVDVLKVVEVNGSGIIQRHIKVIRIAAEQRHGRGGRYCQELCVKSVCRLRLNEVSQQ